MARRIIEAWVCRCKPSLRTGLKRLAGQRLRRLQHRDRPHASQMTAGYSAASLRAALLVLALIPKNALGQNVYGPSGLLQTGPQSAEDAPERLYSSKLYVKLKIETPVYTNMPVWLDVDGQDACMEARYPADILPDLFGIGKSVDITFNGKPARIPSFPAMRLMVDSPVVPAGPCPDVPATGPARSHRYPLHLKAAFDAPGTYRVRWSIDWPAFHRDGFEMSHSDWLTFTVNQSSPAQREAWLAGLLANRPEDAQDIVADYIPSLLAAWQDDRVTRTLMDLTCSDDATISGHASASLQAPFTAASEAHLVALIKDGCVTKGLSKYFSSHVPFGWPRVSTESQKMIIDVLIPILKRPAGHRLVPALTMLHSFQDNTQTGPSRDPIDQAILDAGPTIIAGTSDPAREWLARYLAIRGQAKIPMTDQVLAMLRPLAAGSYSSAYYALPLLIRNAAPADLEFLSKFILGQQQGPATTRSRGEILLSVAACYRDSATPLLHTVASAAPDLETRDFAAMALAGLGDRIGLNDVIAALKRGQARETDLIVENLSGFFSVSPVPNDAASALRYFAHEQQAPNKPLLHGGCQYVFRRANLTP